MRISSSQPCTIFHTVWHLQLVDTAGLPLQGRADVQLRFPEPMFQNVKEIHGILQGSVDFGRGPLAIVAGVCTVRRWAGRSHLGIDLTLSGDDNVRIWCQGDCWQHQRTITESAHVVLSQPSGRILATGLTTVTVRLWLEQLVTAEAPSTAA